MLLRGVRLIDGRGGVAEESAVQIDSETGRIAAVGDTDPGTAERVIDLPDTTVMPGLVDAHVHFSLSGEPSVEAVLDMSEAELTLAEAANARATLESGVTGVRAMGALDVDLALREAVSAGDVPGPRMVANGRSITITGGHGHHLGREVDGPVECRRAVREQVKHGAEFIKFMATGGVTTPGTDPRTPAFTDEEMDALVDEAHRRDVHVAAHAHGAEGIKAAVDAGVDTIEHGTFLDDEAIDDMLAADVTLVPTLSAVFHIVRNTERATPDSVEKSSGVQERHLDSFRRAQDAGVRIAGGTDAGTPFNYHGANSTELTFMADQEMEPLAAIESMTRVAAETVGIDDAGVLEPGAHADLLVLDGDPREDLTVVGDPEVVVKGGEVVAGDF